MSEVTEILQRMARELTEHQAKVSALAAQRRDHRCRLGSYLDGYADAVGAMTDALVGALADLAREERP